MSKESYARGFVKAAAAAGVDQHALAKYVLAAHHEKQAQDAAGSAAGSDIWGSLSSWIDQAKTWYNDPKNKAWKPLVGAGIGALGLGGISKLLGGDFWPGAAIGGLGGVAATQFDWKALSDALGSKNPNGQQTAPTQTTKN